jgi:hypothetical protein
MPQFTAVLIRRNPRLAVAENKAHIITVRPLPRSRLPLKNAGLDKMLSKLAPFLLSDTSRFGEKSGAIPLLLSKI